MNCSPSHLCHSWHPCLLLIAVILCTAPHLQWIVHCQSCGPKVSPRLLREIPCDMNSISFCTQPGNAYPWSAVRRYIFENQGFMKRMYGENRQSQVVREEIARMNDRYDVVDFAAFRSAKSDPLGTVNGNDLNEGAAHINTPERDIEFGQTSSMLLNETTVIANNNSSSIPSGESENATISVSEAVAEPEANQYTTIATAGEQLTKSGAEDGEVEVREEGSPTTPVVDIDNAVASDEAPEKPSKGYNACPITQEVVAPYWANNTRGQTLALLNVYPFEQYIHWEKCAFEGEQMNCREGCRCEQQYRLHRLLAFDPKNECRGIFADWFRFPGCCVCICYDNHERINNRKARL